MERSDRVHRVSREIFVTSEVAGDQLTGRWRSHMEAIGVFMTDRGFGDLENREADATESEKGEGEEHGANMG